MNTRAQASVFVSIKYYAEGIISFEPTFFVSVLEISGRGYHFDDVEKVANFAGYCPLPSSPGSHCAWKRVLTISITLHIYILLEYTRIQQYYAIYIYEILC